MSKFADLLKNPDNEEKMVDSDIEESDDDDKSIVGDSDNDDSDNVDSDDDNESVNGITDTVDVDSNEVFGGQSKFAMQMDEDDDDEDDEEEDDHYLQKFDESIKTNIISEYHPEMQAHNEDEVGTLSQVVRNEEGVIIDPMHKTLPFITKYERARVLGERAKQINAGAKPFVDIAAEVIDGYLIALAEFEQKKIPFIVKRPLPNGGCEYWKLRDLEIL